MPLFVILEIKLKKSNVKTFFNRGDFQIVTSLSLVILKNNSALVISNLDYKTLLAPSSSMFDRV